MWRAVLAVLAVVSVFGATPSPAPALDLPAGFERLVLAGDLDRPVEVAFAKDGRMFIAQKNGVVRLRRANGTLAPDPVVDISDHVNDVADRGLLGIALDAQFDNNGFLYLLYNYEDKPSDPEGPKTARLTRVVVTGESAGPETVLLGSMGTAPCPAPSNTVDCIPADAISHTIGTVRADPDGTLWVGSGDGSGWGYTDARSIRSQDERSYAGKLLHIDRDGRGLPGHPFCPQDTTLSHVCTKGYARGFRNPYRFFLRPGAPLVAADLGDNLAEELDFVQAGRNYGWPCYEANVRPPFYREMDQCKALYAREGQPDGATPPVYSYLTTPDDHAAIIGGPQYTGAGYPADFADEMFIGDFSRQTIKRLRFGLDGSVRETPFATDWLGATLASAPGSGNLISIDYWTPNGGEVAEIVYSPGNLAPVAVATANPTTGVAPLTVRFSGAGSHDPEGDALTYSWDFDDGSAASTQRDPSHTYSAGGRYDAVLTVRDPQGRSRTARVTIQVGARPNLTLDVPERYVAGRPTVLRATATDGDGNALTGGAIAWIVTVNHAGHVHDGVRGPGTSITFTPPADHDTDAHVEVRVTATDQKGLSTTRTVLMQPQTVELQLRSEPSGAPVLVGTTEFTTPASRTAVAGGTLAVTAAASFETGGRTWVFERWSDGEARAHAVTVPDHTTSLVAYYSEVGGPGPTPEPSATPAPTPQAGPDIPADATDPGSPSTGSGTPPAARHETPEAEAPDVTLLPPQGRYSQIVRGRVAGGRGIRAVAVAISAPRCRWWSWWKARFVRRSRCTQPLRGTFPVSGTSWKVNTRGRFTPGRYVVHLRAIGPRGERPRPTSRVVLRIYRRR